MFIKIGLPVTRFCFLESKPMPILGHLNHVVTARRSERTWLAPILVLCAHLAVFAALCPQAPSNSVDAIPEPITVSLLSAPQATPPKPAQTSPPTIEKVQKPVKKPIAKAVVPQVRKASKPVTLPLEPYQPATAANTPIAEPETSAISNKPAPAAAEKEAYQSPSFNAAYLNNPAPNYPPISRRLGEQGLVLLRVQVTADGGAGSVELQTGSGSSRLDQAALAAVKEWRFIPAKRGEQAVSASVVVPVRFSIEG